MCCILFGDCDFVEQSFHVYRYTPGGVEVEVEVEVEVGITCPSWGPGGSYFWNITAGSEK